MAVSTNPVFFFFFSFLITFNYLMDLRSHYLSRFLFLIIWSIVTDMKCHSDTRIIAAAYDRILFNNAERVPLFVRFATATDSRRLSVFTFYIQTHFHQLRSFLNPREAIIYTDRITGSCGKSHSNIRNASLWGSDWIIIMSRF